MDHNSAARGIVFSEQSFVRLLFVLVTVDDFVTVGTSRFNTDQQFSTRSVQQVQY